jgi:hypothetical protein
VPDRFALKVGAADGSFCRPVPLVKGLDLAAVETFEVGRKQECRRTGSLVPPALPVEACECRYGIRDRFHKLRHVVSEASVRVIRDQAIHQLRACLG